MENLPYVLINIICDYLKLANINNLSLMCKRINCITFKYKSKKFYLNAGCLKLQPDIVCNKYYERFVKLCIYFDAPNTIYNMMTILSQFSTIESVEFERAAVGFEHCYASEYNGRTNVNSFFSLANIGNLIELDICDVWDGNEEQDNLYQLIVQKCPKLEKIGYFDATDSLHIFNSLTSLKDLTINADDSMDKLFGLDQLHNLTKLCIFNSGDDPIIIDKDCFPNLVEFELNFMNNHSYYPTSLYIKPDLFPKLKKLKFVDNDIKSIKFMDGCFPDLEYLKIYGFDIDSETCILENNFPKLKTFIYNGEKNICQFVNFHTKLETLQMANFTPMLKPAPSIKHFIANYHCTSLDGLLTKFPNLQTLNLTSHQHKYMYKHGKYIDTNSIEKIFPTLKIFYCPIVQNLAPSHIRDANKTDVIIIPEEYDMLLN